MKRTHSITHSISTPIAGRRIGRPYGLRALRCIAGAFLGMAPLALRAQAPAASGTVLTIAGKGLIGFSCRIPTPFRRHSTEEAALQRVAQKSGGVLNPTET